jgi:branched-chain amino acid transport system substrate-binding protein
MDERRDTERMPLSNADATVRRRPSLRLSVVAAVGLLSVSLLAACGGSDSSSTIASSSDGGGATPSAAIAELKDLLGTPTGDAAGEGTDVTVGALEPMSGPGAVFGEEGVNGFQLAAEQIEAMGGPTFDFDVKDHKSGDAQAGIQATREFGLEGIPVSLTSYQGDLGATFPNLEQYKILSLDPAAGSSAANEGQPYFYGTRGNPETAPVPGLFKYMRSAYPDAKTVYYSAADLGPAINKASEEAFAESAKKYGFESVGSTVTKAGSTDFSDLIGELQSSGADIHFTNLYSPDIAYFMKQASAAGLTMPVIGNDFVPEDAKIAGASMSDFVFGFDYFGPSTPGSKWTELFVKEFEAKYNRQPTLYAANNYEATFALWELLRQIISSGGDSGSGEEWVKALEADPSFPSVYGTSAGDKPGVLEIDPNTHLVSKRAMGVYQAPTKEGETPELLGSFNVDAREFELAK